MGLSFRHVVCFSATMAIGSFFYVLTLAPMDAARHPRAAALDRTPTRGEMVARIREAMAQGQMSAADRWADTLLKHTPGDPSALFYRAIVDRALDRESIADRWAKLDQQMQGLVGWDRRYDPWELEYYRAWGRMGVGLTGQGRAIFAELADNLEASAGGAANEISDDFVHFNLACYHSMAGQTERAMEHWRQAVEHGYGQHGHAEDGWWMVDPDLEALRGDARFWTIGAVLLEARDDRTDPRRSGG